MGRRKGSGGDKPKKRKKVTVKLIPRVHAGEVTEPWKIMEKIKAAEHGDLEGVEIALAWRLGWRSDTDGVLSLAKLRKRGDLDRELDKFDFVVLLNNEAWPTLNAKQKWALIDHELCHARVTVDADGNAKRDDRDRPVCRIRKHDVEEFKVIVERHGLYTQDLAAIAQAAVNDSKRPLLAESEKAADATTDKKPAANAWRKTKIDKVITNASLATKLIDADLSTLGKLSDHMADNGQWWARNLKGIGEAAAEKISDMLAKFWADHPEFTNESTAA